MRSSRVFSGFGFLAFNSTLPRPIGCSLSSPIKDLLLPIKSPCPSGYLLSYPDVQMVLLVDGIFNSNCMYYKDL